MASKSKDYFVDDESFLVSRDGGLGLELLELAGGRSDGYGITIVENGETKKILPFLARASAAD